MVNKLPKDWNIWLEANSNEIDNIEDVWKKYIGQYHKTITWESEHTQYISVVKLQMFKNIKISKLLIYKY